jgi:hypothetical protein
MGRVNCVAQYVRSHLDEMPGRLLLEQLDKERKLGQVAE